MSNDSIFQYIQAKDRIYNDSHPPIMSIIWSYLFIFPDPVSAFLLFQLTLFWSAIVISFYIDQRNVKNKTAYLIFLMPLLPYILNISGVLWKDVQMAYSLFLAIVLIRLREGKNTNTVKFTLDIFIVVLLLYAIAIRVNGVFAVIPIMYYFLSTFYLKISKLFLMFLSGLIVFSAYLVLDIGISKIYSVSKTNTLNVYFVDDLFQYSIKNGISLLPGVPMELITACNDEVIANSDKILKIFCVGPKSNFDYTSIPTQNLMETWLSSIKSDPLFYIRYRYTVFENFLSSPTREPWYFWHDKISPNDLGLSFTSNRLTDAIEKYVYISVLNFKYLFQPYFWFIILLFLLYYLRKTTSSFSLEKSLLISSTLYFASYLPVISVPDYRYIYWISLSITYVIFQNVIRKFSS